MSIKTTDPAKLGFDPKRMKRIKASLQAWVDRGVVAGLSGLVARRGEAVFFDQVGRADIEADAPMTPEAMFRIYSMTKPITAVALMTLWEEGKFQLFDPASTWFPALGKLKVMEAAPDGSTRLVDQVRPVSVRDLLTHTAGFTYDFLEESPAAELYRQAGLITDAQSNLEDWINKILELPLAFQPGSRWSYGFANDLAARLVEILSGQPLAQFMAERIFKPLGMVDTAFTVPPDQQHRLASIYGIGDLSTSGVTMSQMLADWQAGVWGKVDTSASHPVNSPTWARGGYGLYSTVQDYWRFAQMLANGGQLDGARVLGPKTIELMYSNHLPPELLPISIAPSPPYYGWGFGLGSAVVMEVAPTQLPGSVGEHNWSGAARTAFWVDPIEDLVCVLMCQYRGFHYPEYDFRTAVYQALAE